MKGKFPMRGAELASWHAWFAAWVRSALFPNDWPFTLLGRRRRVRPRQRRKTLLSQFAHPLKVEQVAKTLTVDLVLGRPRPAREARQLRVAKAYDSVLGGAEEIANGLIGIPPFAQHSHVEFFVVARKFSPFVSVVVVHESLSSIWMNATQQTQPTQQVPTVHNA